MELFPVDGNLVELRVDVPLDGEEASVRAEQKAMGACHRTQHEGFK